MGKIRLEKRSARSATAATATAATTTPTLGGQVFLAGPPVQRFPLLATFPPSLLQLLSLCHPFPLFPKLTWQKREGKIGGAISAQGKKPGFESDLTVVPDSH